MTTACATVVLRHSRQGAINRAFAAFAIVCVICLTLPVMLFDPFLGTLRGLWLLLLYGSCYLLAPA
ncbi:MAG TPA: hypothetical protein VFX76_16390, partial [Roseiflexaceae bacterium]|nr:hypothetical protein [Roseiflexaceae bacterium]